MIATNTDDTTVIISELPEWRTHRLTALTYLIDVGGQNILRLMESVSDHEGWLTTTWKVEPTHEEKEWVSSKWSDVGEEHSCTTHIFEGKEL